MIGRSLTTSAIIFGIAITCAQGADVQWTSYTQPLKSVLLGADIGSGLILGMGVDSPSDFVLSPTNRYIFEDHQALDPEKITGGIANFQYEENISETDESHYLFLYFRAKYAGLASLDAAYSKVHEERKTSHSIYIFASKEGSRAILTMGPSEPHWPDSIGSEGEDNELDRAIAFAGEFGSHYVSSITYGYNFIVRATISSQSINEIVEFSAKVKANFGALSAGAGISESDRQYLSSQNISISGTMVSGEIVPPRPFFMQTFDEVATFLSDWKSGQFTIKGGPIRAELRSWWSYIPKAVFPKTKSVFAPRYVGPTPAAIDCPDSLVGELKRMADAKDEAGREGHLSGVIEGEGASYIGGQISFKMTKYIGELHGSVEGNFFNDLAAPVESRIDNVAVGKSFEFTRCNHRINATVESIRILKQGEKYNPYSTDVPIIQIRILPKGF